jgi:hypothetical protein
MVQRGEADGALAVVTYHAPHGMDARTLRQGDVVAFGRGAECDVRFGYAPRTDRSVPRVAGHIVVMNGRVFVESSPTVGHRAIEVRSPGRTVQIPIGEGYSPRERKFEVVVRGSPEPWPLAVTVRSDAVLQGRSDDTDPPTATYSLGLTELQQAVLGAYFEPIRNGKLEPATHRTVAARLNYHPNTVREALYGIWTAMFEQGVPMPDISDKRIAVVEAARIHGLVSVG